jgi:hypothetical protein
VVKPNKYIMSKKKEEKEMTGAELDAQKKDMLKFYKEGIPYLTAQLEYEEALMKIDETRLKRDQIQMQRAYLSLTPEEQAQMEEQKEMQEEPETKRPLRTA